MNLLDKQIQAAVKMDWRQVVLNGGPPCFSLMEDGKFCGRAQRWAGHPSDHGFVSLDEMLRPDEGSATSRAAAYRRVLEEISKEKCQCNPLLNPCAACMAKAIIEHVP